MPEVRLRHVHQGTSPVGTVSQAERISRTVTDDILDRQPVRILVADPPLPEGNGVAGSVQDVTYGEGRNPVIGIAIAVTATET